MAAKRVSREQRLQEIIDSADSVIREVGVANCTMSAVAERAGITRAWLYKFFPDVDSLLAALWMSWQRPGALGPDSYAPAGEFAVKEFMLSCIDMWLSLSLGAAIVGNYGLNGSEGGTSPTSTLNNLMYEDWEYRWIDPLTRVGVSRDVAVAAVVTVHASAVGVLLAMHQGRLRRDAAKEVLTQIVDAAIDTSWRISRTALTT